MQTPLQDYAMYFGLSSALRHQGSVIGMTSANMNVNFTENDDGSPQLISSNSTWSQSSIDEAPEGKRS